MSLRGDLFRFTVCAVIAPQVVVIEWFEILAHWNDAGAGCVEGDCGNCFSVDSGSLQRIACGGSQSGHLIGVRLGSKVGVVAAAMQGIGGRGGADGAGLAVDEGDANAECAEVDAGNDGHGLALR